jgi:uncharacterized integral membrane protein
MNMIENIIRQIANYGRIRITYATGGRAASEGMSEKASKTRQAWVALCYLLLLLLLLFVGL